MKNFYIRDTEHAQQIVSAYQNCRNCSDCMLNGPEGWQCSYLYDLARKYLNTHK